MDTGRTKEQLEPDLDTVETSFLPGFYLNKYSYATFSIDTEVQRVPTTMETDKINIYDYTERSNNFSKITLALRL